MILGAAFSSGLEKVVVPFFEPGVPVEYELIRSLNTVVKPKRGKVGVVTTDVDARRNWSPRFRSADSICALRQRNGQWTNQHSAVAPLPTLQILMLQKNIL